ncbi:MAG: hypothetical protein OXU50_02165 [Gammaproteobacteria bacterium]|nr:hypothetical protein [Gammaproteobacteria bacterium]MDD9868689.1 hypothetical protein [Gammaproteobacteria bacterium]
METLSQLPVTNEIASVIWAKKCLEDRNLLAEIKADPATKALGEKVSSMQVHAVQNTADTLNICVPDYKAMNDGTLSQLSEEQMSGVAGGLFFLLPLIGLATAGAVTGAVYGAAATVAGAGVGIASAAGAFDENTDG